MKKTTTCTLFLALVAAIFGLIVIEGRQPAEESLAKGSSRYHSRQRVSGFYYRSTPSYQRTQQPPRQIQDALR